MMWKPVWDFVLQPCSGEKSRTASPIQSSHHIFIHISCKLWFLFPSLLSCLLVAFSFFLLSFFHYFLSLGFNLDFLLIFSFLCFSVFTFFLFLPSFLFPSFFPPFLLSFHLPALLYSFFSLLSFCFLSDDLVDCSREQVQVSLLLLITSAHAVMHSLSLSLLLSLSCSLSLSLLLSRLLE